MRELGWSRQEFIEGCMPYPSQEHYDLWENQVARRDAERWWDAHHEGRADGGYEGDGEDSGLHC